MREPISDLPPALCADLTLLALDLSTASFRPGRFDGGGMRYLRFSNWLTEIDRLSGPV